MDISELTLWRFPPWKQQSWHANNNLKILQNNPQFSLKGKTTRVFVVRREKPQSHCDISTNVNRYGQSINTQLKTSERCPTYKSIDGLQKAMAQSLHRCITIPSQLSTDRPINQNPADGGSDRPDDADCCPNMLEPCLENWLQRLKNTSFATISAQLGQRLEHRSFYLHSIRWCIDLFSCVV